MGGVVTLIQKILTSEKKRKVYKKKRNGQRNDNTILHM